MRVTASLILFAIGHILFLENELFFLLNAQRTRFVLSQTKNSR